MAKQKRAPSPDVKRRRNARRQGELRDRRERAGLVRLDLWVPKHHAERFKAEAKVLMNAALGKVEDVQ